MSQQKTANPWELLALRRKLKKYDDTGIIQCMKILKNLRDMNLQTNMLKCTEMPRILLWISKRISNDKDQNKVKLNKMCRFLFKLWREQIQKQETKQDA